MDSGIYQIRHIPSGRVYIGSSFNIKARWRSHRHQLKSGTHGNRHLQNIWNRDGRVAFAFEVLEHCEPGQLLQCEEAWFLSVPDGLLLNVCLVPTQTVLGIRWKKSPEGVERSRQFHTGKKWGPISDEHKGKLRAANLGRKMSPESIEKWRASRAGWSPSPEAREKLRQANLGKKQSPETIAKRSKAMTGHSVSEETRQKLSVAGTGRKHTDESKAKMRATQLGRKHSDETRRKMSESHKQRNDTSSLARYHAEHPEARREAGRKGAVARWGQSDSASLEVGKQ